MPMSSPPDNKLVFSDISSCGSHRSATPKPGQNETNNQRIQFPTPKMERGGDHTVPKRKPVLPPAEQNKTSDNPPPAPKKYVPFSETDSRAIEAAFQKWVEQEEAAEKERLICGTKGRDLEGQQCRDVLKPFKVPVNEDYLFDVDVEKREFIPAYWLGPVYDVRRGTWFSQDGSPCDENLATQLEEGYLKVEPWKTPKSSHQRSASQPRPRPVSLSLDESQKPASNPITPKMSMDDLRVDRSDGDPAIQRPQTNNPSAKIDPPRTFRLFGSHMGSMVTYENETNAWLVTDDFLSRMSSTVYGRFAGGAHFAGTKLIRGFKESDKTEDKDGKTSQLSRKDNAHQTSKAEDGTSDQWNGTQMDDEEDNVVRRVTSPSENRRITLERQISSLVEPGANDPEKQEEEVRKRDEEEMRGDYKEQEGEEQGREIEHLILVTHGIGQRLGVRLESVNFIHDVNTLRKTLKSVYNDSADLQAFNNEAEKSTKNSRVQVLPVSWRHLLDFPKQSLKHNRAEFDLGDLDAADEEYPNLDDITVEGVPAVRNLITDIGLDILLYQSPAYKGHITRIVLRECNRIYQLFKQRNPSFKGKVTLMGHSLGSAIMFDILCNQRVDNQAKRKNQRFQLEFEVEDFYALGSPIGLFQMLKGRRIAARQTPGVKPAQTPFNVVDDPFLETSTADSSNKNSTYVEITTSSPKCARVFNIFHPTDPIAYRLEPLISPVMAKIKPQPLPYTKKGIFGAPASQGLTGIGARVGQSVSGLWSSFSSGIASTLLTQSLGIPSKEVTKLTEQRQKNRAALSVGAGTNAVAGGVIPNQPIPTVTSPTTSQTGTTTDRQQHLRPAASLMQCDLSQNSVAAFEAGVDGEHPSTLNDTEFETLFSGFQKSRVSQPNKSHVSPNDDDEIPDSEGSPCNVEEQGRRLRHEEAKLRALNENGRVDYSIQEGAFDISILASIASHLSYWADEDVSHFVLSQLLARRRALNALRK